MLIDREPSEVPFRHPWEQLRRLRATRPSTVTGGRRAETFQAALEQFEALFKAATTVGNESKPILLFYGVSQAVRAVTAAAAALEGNNYLVSKGGHGQTVSNLEAPELRDLQCVAAQTGAFPTLIGLLDMERWTKPVAFGELWAAVPELESLIDEDPTPVSVTAKAGEYVSDEQGSRITRVTTGWIPRRTFPDVDFQDQAAVLQGAMDVYPSLRDTPDPTPSPHISHSMPVPSVRVGQRHFQIVRGVDGRLSDQEWRKGALMDATWLTPSLGGTTAPPARLGLWWSLLHALSMRARYEPRQWRNDLKFDSSTVAVPLDNAMNTALTLMPSLIAAAIEKVS